MSLIITVCTSEGIVMASDSRSTYNNNEHLDDKVIVKFGVHYSDTTYKTFLCNNRIGISTCGDGTIEGKSIAGHVENFINNTYSKCDSIESTSKKLLEYFKSLSQKSDVVFHIAGYEKEGDVDVFKVFSVLTANNQCDLIRNNICGANWAGESSTLTRLVKSSIVVDEDNIVPINSISLSSQGENGNMKVTQLVDQLAVPASSLRQPELNIAWELMTLQDGIEFAEYAIKTTIDTMRFQVAPKTVGGPIDILVIKPCGAQWIRHKELHA